MSLECLQEYVLTEIMQTALQNNIVWPTWMSDNQETTMFSGVV